MDAAQKPLELILARNLITSLSTPAFLLGADAGLLYYNEAAGALLGMPFEESGRMSPREWTAAFGPFGEDGKPLDVQQLRLTETLRDGRPAHAEFRIRSARGTEHAIEASAVPIRGEEPRSSGAMILFWERRPEEGAGPR